MHHRLCITEAVRRARVPGGEIRNQDIPVSALRSVDQRQFIATLCRRVLAKPPSQVTATSRDDDLHHGNLRLHRYG